MFVCVCCEDEERRGLRDQIYTQICLPCEDSGETGETTHKKPRPNPVQIKCRKSCKSDLSFQYTQGTRWEECDETGKVHIFTCIRTHTAPEVSNVELTSKFPNWCFCTGVSGPEHDRNISGPHHDQIVWSWCGPGHALVLLHRDQETSFVWGCVDSASDINCVEVAGDETLMGLHTSEHTSWG